MSDVSSESADRWLWSFPEGMVSHHQSLKSYEVRGSDDEPVGRVSWCDYQEGDSYLVVSYHHHLHFRDVHHVVPAGAVASVDHDAHTVTLKVEAAEVWASPEHQDPKAPVDRELIDRFERGRLAGGAVWPYTDV
jgi:hypothetical protein